MSTRWSVLAAPWRMIAGTLDPLIGRFRPAPPAPQSEDRAGRGDPTRQRRGLDPLRAGITAGRPGPCVFAVVVGVAGDDLAAVVGRLVSESLPRPIFLTDDDRFEVFRRHRAVFEYLPSVTPAPDLDVELYRLRRLALLRRKWQPTRIVAFGPEAAKLIQAWRTSPFEDQRIVELTGGPAVRNLPPNPTTTELRPSQ